MSRPRSLNPVLFKDLLVFAGAPGGAVSLRAFMVALLAGGVTLAAAWAVLTFPGPWRFGGRPLLLALAGLLALFNFSVAVPAATAFALERDRETLEGLVVSPLTPWQLVLGKLAAALIVGLTVKSALFPALALAFALGGADLGFVPAYLAVILATDCSFASFALLVGARRLEGRARIGWLRTRASQSQLALQSSVGITVLASLLPVYAAIFLIPLALAQGAELAGLLDSVAILGALHPLAALVLWGDARVLGLPVPVWLIGVMLHLLLALPLLADAAEAQRSASSAPGRLPRLLGLPALTLVLVLTGSLGHDLAQRSPVAQALLGALVPFAALLLVVTRTSFGAHSEASDRRLTRARVLGSLWPVNALESAPERAPGYALWLALGCSPLVVISLGGGPSAWAVAGGMLVMACGLSTVGVRLLARARDEEERAFLAALDASSAAGGGDDETEEANASRGRARLVLRLILASVAIPVLCAVGVALGDQGLPGFAPLRQPLGWLATAGLALNPLAALLPGLTDPAVVGSSAVADGLSGYGIRAQVAFGLHLAVYGGALVGSLLSLRPPLDLEQALAARLAEVPPEPLLRVNPTELASDLADLDDEPGLAQPPEEALAHEDRPQEGSG